MTSVEKLEKKLRKAELKAQIKQIEKGSPVESSESVSGQKQDLVVNVAGGNSGDRHALAGWLIGGLLGTIIGLVVFLPLFFVFAFVGSVVGAVIGSI